MHEFEGDVVTIGSGDGADLPLEGSALSAVHLRLVVGARGATAHHAGMSPRTRVHSDGTETASLETGDRRLLENGDVLHFGDDAPRIRVHFEADPEPSHVLEIRELAALDPNHAPAERLEDLLAALTSLHETVTDGPDLAEVVEAIADAALRVVPRATHATVVLRDPPDDEDGAFVPVLTRTRGLDGARTSAAGAARVVRSIFRKVVRDRAAVVVVDAAGSELSSESLLGAGIRSTVAVPLWRGARIVGVMQLDSRDAPAMFESDDVDTLAALALSATLAVDNARLIDRLRATEVRLASENDFLRSRPGPSASPSEIIGHSAAMRALLEQVDKVAATRATVLIRGETGSGKELVARALHDRSNRKGRLFVAQNCAALPEHLLESELFGHRRGAFTGATEEKKGLFEIADGGTLFLDEIGEMPAPLQAKLLRVLQDGEIRRVGDTKSERVDVRLVSATHRDLERDVAEGRFRQDLYYRLAVFPLQVPPLRQRPEDIPRLAAFFLERYQGEFERSVLGLAEDTLEVLRGYEWPGNVRELQNEIQRLVILATPGTYVSVDLLSPSLRRLDELVSNVGANSGTLKERVERLERHVLAEALRAHGNNKTSAAKELGITREGLHKKLKQLGIA